MKHKLFEKGDSVNVKLMDLNPPHEFTGTVVDVSDTSEYLLIVEDEDGDFWEAKPEQCSFCGKK